jgi:acetylglutamate kinase
MTEVRQQLTAAFPEADYYLAELDTHVAIHGQQGLIAIRADETVVGNPVGQDQLADSVAYLYHLGYAPMIVHAGERQFDRSKYLVDALTVRGAKAEALSRAVTMPAPSLLNVETAQIHPIIDQGKIPIIGSLALLEGGDEYNRDEVKLTDQEVAAAIVGAFGMMKYFSVTAHGGIHTTAGDLVPWLTPTYAQRMLDQGTVSSDAQGAITAAENLVKGSVIKDVILAQPHAIVPELFTHEGRGTLFTRDADLQEFTERIPDHEPKIRELIETAFDGRLVPGYFRALKNPRFIVSPHGFDGVGIFVQPEIDSLQKTGCLYMDKLAVGTGMQNRGIASQIIEAASRTNGLYWRTDSSNTELIQRYAKLADGSAPARGLEDKQWTVFWRNIPRGLRMPSKIVKDAASRPATITRNAA